MDISQDVFGMENRFGWARDSLIVFVEILSIRN